MVTVIGVVFLVAEFCTHPEKNDVTIKMKINPVKILSFEAFFCIIEQNQPNIKYSC
jgi:hypothetical protein